MRVEKVRVEGFRLLEDVELLLEPASTLIVGRNNSGKTSLTDVFDRFSGESSSRFRLEDFSAGQRPKFLIAKHLVDNGQAPSSIIDTLPKIVVTLSMRYDMNEEFGPLSPFVIDLDETSTAALIRMEYAPKLATVSTLFGQAEPEEGVSPADHFYRGLRDTIPKAYGIRLFAVDPTNPADQREFEGVSNLNALIQCSFIGAQRTLDLSKPGETDVIGKLLGKLFQTATSATAAEADQQLAQELKSSVGGIEKGIQAGFDTMVQGLLPALNIFGFPSLNDTELRPETSLNVESLLADHTRILYTGHDGVHLPEGYNGLGTRNLIYILLKLEAFHKEYRARPTRPGVHIVFVEEPEAHLHPQMQEVFIGQLNQAAAKLSESYPGEPQWQVQFVVSTHSSHLANAASFEAIRYFLSSTPNAAGIRHTKVKDFRKGLDTISLEDRNFLHQYMTLTKCDLYFADKAILVEGTTERILMPRICRLVDEGLPDGQKLTRQYVSTVEVSGAYASKFYPLLDFLELKSLVITDLDALYLDEAKKPARWKKCPTAKGNRSGNAALRAWYKVRQGEALLLADLAAKQDADKISGYCRIAYQIPEPGSAHCARSYEDALILANPQLFVLTEEDRANDAWDKAQELHKTDTALDFAIREEAWVVPHYIREGLIWLSQPPPPPTEPPAIDAGAEQHAA
ncbi:AAA family ATPase [Gluconobacter oxydans]|uniref:AAA family ATPase n=1 Tax=Gluconobacter oxydans TaxID=442 RepID=UPI00209F49DF|nr:ATP-dependent endonuclease [Gluconobacter oxydans]MCP1249857.1 ATP-dependent endonuclease [Gluconobacter oxydans]